eukprot:scaffold1157_cov122-Cylindrotheca_fusiformis.AAC.12
MSINILTFSSLKSRCDGFGRKASLCSLVVMIRKASVMKILQESHLALLFISVVWTVSAFQQRSPAFQLRPLAATAISSAATTVIEIDEGAQRDIGTFDEWAVSVCGIQRVDGFQLVATTNEEEEPLDVGVMTNQDLPAGTPVVFVPNEVTLSANRAKEELGPVPAAEDLFAQLGATSQLPRFYLFLKLLREYELGEQSPWFPWLNSLPRYFSSGASMTDFCCTEVLPPLVRNLAMLERTRFKQYLKGLDYCDFLSPETRGNKKLAKWAYNVCLTRSFQDGYGDYKIAPMADMFNHDTQFEIQGQYDEEGNFMARTIYDVPAGSPLRMSYTAGDSSNPSFLFARYGFVDESSPATFCKIMVPNPSKEILDMGYDHSRMLFYRDTGEISQEVWDVLLYQILENLNPEHQQALYEAHMSGDDETKQALHGEYYSETLSVLKNHVETFLNELDELSSRTIGKDLNEHPRIPIILKHNEFVKDTFLKVRENLQ